MDKTRTGEKMLTTRRDGCSFNGTSTTMAIGGFAKEESYTKTLAFPKELEPKSPVRFSDLLQQINDLSYGFRRVSPKGDSEALLKQIYHVYNVDDVEEAKANGMIVIQLSGATFPELRGYERIKVL